MTPISFGVACIAALATVFGLLSIVWVRMPASPHGIRRGSFLFLSVWLFVGLGAVVAMWQHPRYILPFCLIQGGLLILMLWGEDQPLEERHLHLHVLRLGHDAVE